MTGFHVIDQMSLVTVKTPKNDRKSCHSSLEGYIHIEKKCRDTDCTGCETSLCMSLVGLVRKML